MKDYAKKNYTQRKKKLKSRLFIFIGIVFVGIAMIIHFLHPLQKKQLKKTIINHKTPTEKIEIKAPINTALKESPVSNTDVSNKPGTPDFDFSFYKMLPKMRVITPKVQSSTKNTVSGEKQYFLQVSSSRDVNGANLLIKQLNKYGFPTVMTVSVRRHTRWYHIFLGPYTYLNQAKTDQYRLYRDFNMNGILRVVNNKPK